MADPADEGTDEPGFWRSSKEAGRVCWHGGVYGLGLGESPRNRSELPDNEYPRSRMDLGTCVIRWWGLFLFAEGE